MGSRVATPVAVGAGWGAGAGAGGAGEDAGIGRVSGRGVEVPHAAVRATSKERMRRDLMVDSAARRPRCAGR